jgi:hypothetical protein
MSLELIAAYLTLILGGWRLSEAVVPDAVVPEGIAVTGDSFSLRGAAPEYSMGAAAMSFQLHGRGNHAV